MADRSVHRLYTMGFAQSSHEDRRSDIRDIRLELRDIKAPPGKDLRTEHFQRLRAELKKQLDSGPAGGCCQSANRQRHVLTHG